MQPFMKVNMVFGLMVVFSPLTKAVDVSE